MRCFMLKEDIEDDCDDIFNILNIERSTAGDTSHDIAGLPSEPVQVDFAFDNIDENHDDLLDYDKTSIETTRDVTVENQQMNRISEVKLSYTQQSVYRTLELLTCLNE